MAKVIAGMTMSLDGFVQDAKGTLDGLYTDFEKLHKVPSFQQMIANTGAVIMGRHTYEMADPFEWVNEDYEFQTPLFILTHNPPEKYPAGNNKLSVNFVSDGIQSALSQAKEAAGNKDVQIIGGPFTIQQFVNAGLCDELQIDIMPVLLGKGLRLFENIDLGKINLERLSVEMPTPVRTSLKYKISVV